MEGKSPSLISNVELDTIFLNFFMLLSGHIGSCHQRLSSSVTQNSLTLANVSRNSQGGYTITETVKPIKKRHLFFRPNPPHPWVFSHFMQFSNGWPGFVWQDRGSLSHCLGSVGFAPRKPQIQKFRIGAVLLIGDSRHRHSTFQLN